MTTRTLPAVLTALLLLAAAPLRAAEHKDKRPSPEEAVDFRDSILQYYGFTPDAKLYIRRNAQVRVESWGNEGGGTWDPVAKMVTLQSTNQESALREFALVWWDGFRQRHKDAPRRLTVALAAVAAGKGSADAVAEAKRLLYGDPSAGFAGYLCHVPVSDSLVLSTAAAPGCADPKRLVASDFDFSPGAPQARVQDREMFADLAAWTMGRFKTGAHALPKRLWPFFEPLFTGKIYRTPYYDGGIP